MLEHHRAQEKDGGRLLEDPCNHDPSTPLGCDETIVQGRAYSHTFDSQVNPDAPRKLKHAWSRR
jgi:hypothetical protein